MANPNGRQRGRPMTLMAISDIELLGIVDDLADENGWTANQEVRLQLDEDLERISGVPQRIAWMRRYGWLERNESGEHRLTAMGHAILEKPELRSTLQAQLDKLNPAQRLVLTEKVALAAKKGPEEIHNAVRRQWTRNIRG